MNWNAIGAVGQILGSLATFVTVGFLVVQLHDGEIEARRAIAQARADRSIELQFIDATDERLAAIHVKVNSAVMPDMQFPFFKAATEQAGLTNEEAFSLFSEQLARWTNLVQSIAYADNLLPEDRPQFDSSMRLSVSEPTFRFWYNNVKQILNPDAVRYVDNLLAQWNFLPLAPNSSTLSPSTQEGTR